MIHKTNLSLIFQMFLLSILSLSLLWFYWPVLLNLGYSLTTSEDYSFGLLLPIVSGYIVYLKWPELRQRTWMPSWLGLLIIAFGFILYALGDLAAVFYFPPISFLFVIIGLLWLLGGRSLVSELAFPLFLLFFMIPLPSVLMKTLTLPLQLISSQLAAGMLQSIGIPLVREGNVINMGIRQLQVVDACSGLRYILSLSALGLIYCYFYQRCLWKTVILLICLAPAAILANSFRVAAMGIFPALQEGFWHSFSGWLIFVFCFALLGILNWFLNYLKPSPPLNPVKEASNQTKGGQLSSKPSVTIYLIAALVLSVVAGNGALRLAEAPPLPLLQSFDAFPLTLGSYHGSRAFLDEAMAKAVGADAYLEANYNSAEKGPVSLWIGYFESQSKKVEGRIHSPLICLTGSGWRILESRIIDVAPGLPVRYLLMQKGDVQNVVYYWYLQQGSWLASEYSSRLFMGWNGLIKHRNDGAIVRLITPAYPNVAQARERLSAFTHLLLPVLPQFISK